MSSVTDKGIVLMALGSGTTAVSVAPGYSGTPRIMYSGTFRASDSFDAGNAGMVAVTVQSNIATSGAGLLVGLERQRAGGTPQFSGQPKWSLVTSYRSDVGSGGQIHQLVKSAFAGRLVDTSNGLIGSGSATETLAITLTTDQLQAAGPSRVIAAVFSGSFGSGDWALVSVDCR